MSLLWEGIRIMIKRENWERYSEVGAKKIIFLIREELHEKQKNEF